MTAPRIAICQDCGETIHCGSRGRAPIRCRGCSYTHNLVWARVFRQAQREAKGQPYQSRARRSAAQEEALRRVMQQEDAQIARQQERTRIGEQARAVRSENQRRYRAWLSARFGAGVVAPC